jgi:hypothetical protein
MAFLSQLYDSSWVESKGSKGWYLQSMQTRKLLRLSCSCSFERYNTLASTVLDPLRHLYRANCIELSKVIKKIPGYHKKNSSWEQNPINSRKSIRNYDPILTSSISMSSSSASSPESESPLST